MELETLHNVGHVSRTETTTSMSDSGEEDLYSSDSEIQQSGLLKDVSVNRFSKEDAGSDLWEQLSRSSSSLSASRLQQSNEVDPVLTRQELIRQIHLRRHVNQLRRKLEEKERAVVQLREQLTRCREHVSDLLSQKTSLEAQISEREEARHMAALGMLRSQVAKVKSEIGAEELVEQDIQEKLFQAELDLSEARMSSSKFDELEGYLERGEGAVREMKGRQATQRLQAETRLLVHAERSRKMAEMEFESTVQEHDRMRLSAIEQARRAQEKGKAFLHETMERHRREEARERERERYHLEERVRAILSLKNNTESAQGTIQAQQLLKREKEKKKKKQDDAEREKIIASGGNPDEVFLRRKRLAEFEKSREDFKKRQEQRQLEIVSQLLEEDKVKKRMEKLYSKPHWHERQELPHPTKRKTGKRLGRKSKARLAVSHDEDDTIGVLDEPDKGEGVGSSDEEAPGHQDDDGITLTPLHDEVLAEPEIRGLWEDNPVIKKQSHDGGVKREMSKAEMEMMRTAMEKLRRSVVVKQVAAGREFKGRPFISKPEEVVFKDFEVGKTYHKRLQLTNISYTVNYCRLVGVSDNLKDFISIDFNPPGSMSAGITCSMVVTFEPKLNSDLDGEIELLSQTGPFSIPVRCRTKRCVISCDRKEVEFGEVVIGETVRRSITLHNRGALGTKFTLAVRQPTPPQLQVTSKSLIESSRSLAPSHTLSDKSHLSIMSTMEMSPSRMDSVGLTVVGGEGEGLKSRSTGDLSSASQKSLAWADQKKSQGAIAGETNTETVTEQASEAPVKQDDQEEELVSQAEEEEAPGNQPPCQVVIERAESQVSSHCEEVFAESAITIGNQSEGEIPPFSSRLLELVFSPKTAAQHTTEFQLSFSDPSLPPVIIVARGRSTDLPVYVERENIDLRMCMIGRLYQDSIILHNRAATALRVTFDIPSPLKAHLDVLPEQGLVQGESSFAAQLKFTPQENIFDTVGEEFLDPLSGSLSVPLNVVVVGQTTPVPFTVTARVTSSELQFSPEAIDFGPCTTHESVVASLQITNLSVLHQKFGFVNLPACVEVQPNDGFGHLLPRESVTVDVIFSAKKPKDYSFELICKTGIDKTYKLQCHGLGVLPALELSDNSISFSPTALSDVTTTSISVLNPALSRLNSAVIRGAVQPQGPKSFEFVIPRGIPITICPQVGVVNLGESTSVQVQFSPKLDSDKIEEEALRLAKELIPPPKPPSRLEELEAESQTTNNKKKPKRHSSRSGNKSSLPSSSKASLASSSQTKASSTEVGGAEAVDTPKEGSPLWWRASSNLISSYENRCLRLNIPCFVSSLTRDTTSYRAEDTLYLSVRAPIVRPGLMVVSDSGSTSVDMGSVGTGDSAIRTLTVRNISNHLIHLRSSLLDPHGPFEVRNALRDLRPGDTHNLAIKFSPLVGGNYYEPLKLYYGHASSLEVRLKGVAVKPEVSLSLEGEGCGTDRLDMGHVMSGDMVTKTLTLQNSSPLEVKYSLLLESLQPGAGRKRGRASNYSGQPPFCCKPSEGVIGGGANCEVGVSFSPDHQSLLYSDLLEVVLNGQHAYTIDLCGKAWSNNMYITTKWVEPDTTSHPVQPSVDESMSAVVPLPDGHTPSPTPIVVLLVHHVDGETTRADSGGKTKAGGSEGAKVTREVEVGCVKTALVKKTTGEFVIDPVPSTNPHAKAFTFDPIKSSVEAGSTRMVSIAFHPPRGSCNQTIEAETNLTLKGDSVQVFKLLLRGMVCE